MVFEVLGIRQLPWEMPNEWSASYSCAGSWPGHIVTRERESAWSTAVFLSGKDEAGSLGRPRNLYSQNSVLENRELYRYLALKICRGRLVSLQLSADQHTRKYPRPRKEPLIRVRVSIRQCSQRTGSPLFPAVRVENLAIYRQMGIIHRKFFPLQWGKISPKLLQFCLTELKSMT